jgi:hypothetical protein
LSGRELLPGVLPFGGISQQPPHAALPNQVADAVNLVADVATGLTKRNGTWFERKFTDTPKGDLRLENWAYNAADKYRVVFGVADSNAILRAFKIGGNESVVTISADALAYLQSGSPTSGDIKLVPVKDFLLVINSKVAPSLIASDSYVSFGDRSEYESAITLTLGIGDRVRVLADSAGGLAGYYQYEPGNYTFGHMNFPVITSPWSISGGYWDDSGYFPCGFRIAFRRVALASFSGFDWNHTTRALGKTGSGQFAGHTHRSGDQIFISGGTGFTASKWYEVEEKTSDDFLKLKVQPGLGGATVADIASNDGTGTAPIGIEVEVNLDLSQQSPASKSMDWIASKVQDSMRAGGATNACCAWVPQKVGGSFQITGPYRGSGSRVYAPTAPTQTVGASGNLAATGGPFDAAGVSVAGVGSIGTDEASTSPGSRWVRVAPPNQPFAKLDPTTMPMVMERTGSTTFNVDVGAWKQRASGDANTNPGLKLASKSVPIAHAVWFKERLVLGGGTLVEASTVADPFNFWVEDVAEVVDSDPISKSIPSGESGDVRYFVEFASSLVTFCEQAQYELTSADQPLTPKTAQLVASTSYSILPVAPKRSTTQVYFAAPRGNYAVIAEYFQDQLRVSSEAAEVTAHVPRLVPSSVRSVVPLPGSQTVLVTLAESASVYCYRYFFEGGQKQQSAWTKFEFGYGTYRICDVAAVDNVAAILNENAAPQSMNSGACRLTLPSHGYSNSNPIWLSESTTTPSVDGKRYVKVIDSNTVEIYTDSGLTSLITLSTGGTARWHSGTYVVETLTIGDSQDASWPCPVHMDRKMILTGSHSAGVTTFNLPNSPTVATGSAQFSGYGSTLNKVVLSNEFGASAGEVLSISAYGPTTVQVVGNYSAGRAMLGSYFNHKAIPLRPFVRDSRGRADVRKNVTVISLILSLYLTCSIKVKATRLYSTDRERGYSLGPSVKTYGVLETWLEGDADDTQWIIEDYTAADATRPLTISSIQWDIEYSPEGGKDGL